LGGQEAASFNARFWNNLVKKDHLKTKLVDLVQEIKDKGRFVRFMRLNDL
jgi:hypothetical protein